MTKEEQKAEELVDNYFKQFNSLVYDRSFEGMYKNYDMTVLFIITTILSIGWAINERMIRKSVEDISENRLRDIGFYKRYCKELEEDNQLK